MSIKQIEPFIRPCALSTNLPPPQAPWVFYFLYAYDECLSFREICPEAKLCNIATLQDWVWHINVKGKPNVRKMFYNDRDPYQTGVKSITVGWVFRAEKTADERIHTIFGADRVRMGQTVSITDPKCPTSKPCKLAVVLYWDPRNTCDSDRWEWSQETLSKWETALEAMRGNGVQRWYIDHVLDTINKRKTLEVDDKAKCFNPQDLSYTPSVPFTAPPRFRNAKLHTPHGSRHKAGKVAAGLQTTPNKPTSRPHAATPQSTPRQQGHPDPRSAPRPKPTDHSQSSPQPQMTPLHLSATTHNRAIGSPTHPRPTTPTSTTLSPNVAAKKRKLDAGNDGGQPLKKQMLKKPPPGPSKLRYGTSTV